MNQCFKVVCLPDIPYDVALFTLINWWFGNVHAHRTLKLPLNFSKLFTLDCRCLEKKSLELQDFYVNILF